QTGSLQPDNSRRNATFQGTGVWASRDVVLLPSSSRESVEKGRRRASIRLSARELHYLAPLLGLVHEELVEVGGAAGKQRGAELGEALLRDRIGEDRVGRLVELLDDVGGRALRHAEAVPRARLVAGQKLRDGRQVRQHVGARRAGGRKPAQAAGLH